MTTRVITLAGDPEAEARLAAELSRRRDVDLVLRCVDRGELLGSIRGAALDAVVSVGAPPWFDQQCAKEAAERALRVVGLTDDPFQADRLRSLGGAVLSISSTADEVLEACLFKPAAPIGPPTELPQAGGDLIAVWGPKGSPGRTRVAIELAFELGATESSTLLIDGDPYGGDILQLLGILDELPTVVWASRMAAKDELTAASLSMELRRTDKAGPLLLPGIPRPDLWAEISDFGWRALLSVARSFFGFTVCDIGFCLEPDPSQFGGGEGRNRMARGAVAAADHVVAVCRGDSIGVKNFVWSFQQLTDLVDPDDVVVIVNRNEQSEEQEIGRLLRRYIGKRPLAFIPERTATWAKAVRSAVPVSRLQGGSESTSAMRVLAEAMGGRVESHGLLARMAGNR